jgi:hypothetical protein
VWTTKQLIVWQSIKRKEQNKFELKLLWLVLVFIMMVSWWWWQSSSQSESSRRKSVTVTVEDGLPWQDSWKYRGWEICIQEFKIGPPCHSFALSVKQPTHSVQEAAWQSEAHYYRDKILLPALQLGISSGSWLLTSRGSSIPPSTTCVHNDGSCPCQLRQITGNHLPKHLRLLVAHTALHSLTPRGLGFVGPDLHLIHAFSTPHLVEPVPSRRLGWGQNWSWSTPVSSTELICMEDVDFVFIIST